MSSVCRVAGFGILWNMPFAHGEMLPLDCGRSAWLLRPFIIPSSAKQVFRLSPLFSSYLCLLSARINGRLLSATALDLAGLGKIYITEDYTITIQ